VFVVLKRNWKGDMETCMKFVLAALGVLAVQAVQAQHWGYTGATGPEHWSELESNYAMCGQGRNPTVSSAQVQQSAKTLGFSNNRPLQPVNARVVAK